MFVKNKAKVASRVGCSERSVMCFRKLLRKSDKKKLSFRRVESEGLQSSRKRAVVEHFASEWNSDRWKERKSYITLHYIKSCLECPKSLGPLEHYVRLKE